MKRLVFRATPLVGLLSLLIGGGELLADATTEFARTLFQKYGDWVLGTTNFGAPPAIPTIQGEEPLPTPSPSETVYTCRVRVVDEVTGKPISGVRVQAVVGRDVRPTPGKRVTDDAGQTWVRRTLKAVPQNAAAPGNPESWNSRDTLFLSVEHDDYCSASANWYPTGGPMPVPLPATFEFRLTRGATIGGTIFRPDGSPANGAIVSLSESFNQLPAGVQRNAPPIPVEGIRADVQGRWIFHRFPTNALPGLFYVRDSEGGQAVFGSPGANNPFGVPADRYTDFDKEKLFTSSAEFRLPEGLVVKGQVIDLAGKPVAGATILEWHGWQPLRLGNKSITDQDGRFILRHRQPKEWLYTVMAPGHGPTSWVAEVKADMPEMKIVLPPPTPLQIRVVDASGKPVPSFRLLVSPESGFADRTPKRVPTGLAWTDETDAEGRITWSNAPATPLAYAYVNPAGGLLSKKWRGGSSEVLVLNASTNTQPDISHLNLRVLDSKTRKPLERVEVSSRTYPHLPWQQLFTTNRAEFELTYPSAAPTPASFQIQAPGYQGVIINPHEESTGDTREILLIGESLVRIKLLDPQGEPIPNANAYVAPDRESYHRVHLNRFDKQRLRVSSQGLRPYKSNAEGYLQLPVGDPELMLGIMNDDFIWTGKVGDLEGKSELTLKPFGSVAGKVLAEGRPVPNLQIAVTFGYMPGGESIVSGSMNGVTKADGSFFIGTIPPGKHQLQRTVEPRRRLGTINYSHPKSIQVGPDEALLMDYTFGGVGVSGTIECDGEIPEDWSDCEVLLQSESTAPGQAVLNDFVSAARFSASRGGFNPTASGTSFRGFVESDASFSILDVPPGKYSFKAIIHRPGKQERKPWEPIPVIGQTEQSVEISSGGTALELGNITVKTSEVSPSLNAATAKPLSAIAENGKTLPITPIPGQTAVLVFWATWSEKSQALLRETQERIQSTKSNVELVALNIDDEPVVAAAYVREKKLPGRHLTWGDALRAEGLAQSGLDSLPSVWILSDQGKVTRDPSSKRLAALWSNSGKK